MFDGCTYVCIFRGVDWENEAFKSFKVLYPVWYFMHLTDKKN